ncbi:MAG: site-2 protease family protein [Hyphomonadaceae bacterium]|nr:site-2 protease family protein [Hyphomonadaceae bacterium]
MPELLQSIQGLLVTLASFVVVLSVVVFVHEFGHFQVARWRGVAIDTFSIGFGKTLFGWRDKKGVQWKVGALPLGGYVKFADDADAMSTAPREKIEDPAALAEARNKGLFHAQPLSTRSMVVAAGPLTNFVFSIFAFGLLAFAFGRDVPSVASVEPNSPASAAGLRPGDVVRSIDGQRVGNFQDLQRLVALSPGRTLTLVALRDEREVTVQITPRSREDNPQMGSIGITHDSSPTNREPIGPVEAIGVGAANTWAIIAQTG